MGGLDELLSIDLAEMGGRAQVKELGLDRVTVTDRQGRTCG
jgi:hypothetical protein